MRSRLMEFREFYLSLDPDEREIYAKRVGTTTKYMPQLIAERPFKVPKPALMRALADKSDGHVSLEEVLTHFYGAPIERGPRRASDDESDAQERVSQSGPERIGKAQEDSAQA
jgi:hypothetical protein